MGYQNEEKFNTRMVTWEDSLGKMYLLPESGETYRLRAVGRMYMVKYHGVPFLQGAKQFLNFYPQQCLNYDFVKDEMIEDGDCPACKLLGPENAKPAAILRVIDIDALYAGRMKKAVRIMRMPAVYRLREMKNFNGEVSVLDSAKGRIFLCVYDKSADKKNRWQLNMSDKMPVKIDGDTLKVKIPEDAESDMAGKVVTLELPDLDKLVFAPKLEEIRQKMTFMKVKEAYARMKKKDKEEDIDRAGKDEDDDEDEDKPKRKPKRDEDEGEEEKPKRKPKRDDDEDKPKRKPKDDDEDGSWDDDEGEEEKPKRKPKRDDDEGEEEKPKRKPKDDEDKPKRKPATKPKRTDDDEWGDEDEGEEEKPKKKKPSADIDDDSGDDEWDDEGEEKPKRKPKRDDDEGEEEKPKRKPKRDEDEDDGF